MARNVPTVAWLEGGRRIREKALPLEAVREAIVNAAAHRDYSLTGTDIEVSVYRDRVEIISPGRLPNGVTVEKMKAGIRPGDPRDPEQRNGRGIRCKNCGHRLPSVGRWRSRCRAVRGEAGGKPRREGRDRDRGERNDPSGGDDREASGPLYEERACGGRAEAGAETLVDHRHSLVSGYQYSRRFAGRQQYVLLVYHPLKHNKTYLRIQKTSTFACHSRLHEQDSRSNHFVRLSQALCTPRASAEHRSAARDLRASSTRDDSNPIQCHSMLAAKVSCLYTRAQQIVATHPLDLPIHTETRASSAA